MNVDDNNDNNFSINHDNAKKLWSGRFKESPSSYLEGYTESISLDKEFLQDDLIGTLAHTKTLNKIRIIDDEEYLKVKSAIVSLLDKASKNNLDFHIEYEDVHTHVEKFLQSMIGDTALKIHTGRSRNDQVALDMRMYLRRNLLDIIELLLLLQKKIKFLAQENKNILITGYTHTQHAQPVYLATHFMCYVAMFERDVERFMSAWERINTCPLGAGAINGSSFPINKYYTSELLGFEKLHSNAMDAVSDRDFLIEFISFASILMMHLSRLCEELILWSTTEFNFIQIGDSFCTGSSMMPQKKNPDIAELMRGKTGRVYGALINILTIMKALPLTYNRDMQEDKMPLFDTVKTIKMSITILEKMFDSITLNEDCIRSSINKGYLNATSLAEYLVKKNVPFRNAHFIAGRIVSFCIEKNINVIDAPLSDLKGFSEFIAEDIYENIKNENIVKMNDTCGYRFKSTLETQFIEIDKFFIKVGNFLKLKRDLISCNSLF